MEVQDNRGCLVDLPTELLVKILSYLPIRDKVMTRFVSRRFKDVSEMPLLWKNFVWPDYEPRHVCIVSKLLKAHGKHVTQLMFPGHVTPACTLKMARCCTKVTHLCLPSNTQLSVVHLEEIVRTMRHLEKLDLFTSGIKCVSPGSGPLDHSDVIKQLLESTGTVVRNLILRVNDTKFSTPVTILVILEALFKEGRSLPSVINLLIHTDYLVISSNTLESWLVSSFTMPSCEIGLYDIKKVPMNLYPSMPLRKFWFGPAAAPYLIKLSDYGVMGLMDNVYYISCYDYNNEVRHSITSKRISLSVLYEDHLHCINNLYSVTNIDFFRVNIYPDHLEQLATACPNLERLNLMNADYCLRNLQGLQAIVNTCKNLQGLNLVGILVSSVQSCLLLWELLSSIERLTHLAIDWCTLLQINYGVADRKKLVDMLRNCNNLKALEMIQTHCCLGCENVRDTEDLLFSHFPSLQYVRLSQFDNTSAFGYTIMRCHYLKYFYYRTGGNKQPVTIPLPSKFHLQELFIESQFVDLSSSSVHGLSVHGKLEHVALLIWSVTTNAITTLISNSPNLISLHIITKQLLCDEVGCKVHQKNFKDTVTKTFSYHKLFTVGDFTLLQDDHPHRYVGEILCDFGSNLSSLWGLS